MINGSTGIDAELGYEPGEPVRWSELVETPARRKLRRKKLAQFIAGPLPLAQFFIAAGLPGKALAAWVLIHFRTRLTGRTEVTLPASLLGNAGIDRSTTKAHALRSLEDAGLIRVSRAHGRASRITLVEQGISDE